MCHLVAVLAGTGHDRPLTGRPSVPVSDSAVAAWRQAHKGRTYRGRRDQRNRAGPARRLEQPGGAG
ncbi:hypothetical protein CITRIK5_30065 [Citricoccus sp. K5]|nr:hypothetical protein CITRIK5_30065 [Citricoccus sp. K5]